MKKKFLVVLAIGVFWGGMATVANAANYYEQWADNLFNMVEVNYSQFFYSHQNTDQLNVENGLIYYRLYDNEYKSGLAVYISFSSQEVYYRVYDDWYLLGSLDYADSILCQYSCRPSTYNSNDSSGDDWWNDQDTWDNPDAGATGCYGYCSWDYSTHTCNCD